MTLTYYYTRQELESVENEFYNKLERGFDNRCWHNISQCNCGGISTFLMEKWIRMVNQLTGELARMEAENTDVTSSEVILELMGSM